MIPEFRRLKPQLQIPLLAERIDLCRKFLDILVCTVAVFLDDPHQMAEVLAERTHSQVVQVIGRKIVLYREGKDNKKKIILP